MSNVDIIRAWKDVEYRESLSEEQRELLPENPVGAMELTDTDLVEVVGGLWDMYSSSSSCCGSSCCLF